MKPRKASKTRLARSLQTKRHDTYRARRKSAHAMVCGACGVVCHRGRYYWGVPPVGHEQYAACPACRRIKDRCPAGQVTIRGVPEVLLPEVRSICVNTAEQECREHPLERIIRVLDEDGALEVSTTGTHLPRCLAGALRRRFGDGVRVEYPPGEHFVRVEWAASSSTEGGRS
jgi:hypothetical protein